MPRAYNFGAGPAMLPEEILQQAQADLWNWNDQNMSILEIGHRTPIFMELMEETNHTLRRLLKIPDNYEVLFISGPARMQFSMIPLNLISKKTQAGYLISGIWSATAFEEATKVSRAYCIASSEATQFKDIPDYSFSDFKENTDYLYYTTNETVNGVRFPGLPVAQGIPLVSDMTSSILTEPINVNDYGLIFAGAQKNIANAGLTIVIIRKDFLSLIDKSTLPTIMDYETFAKHKSLYATPPTFNCYLALKMFQWVEEKGGVDALYQANMEKARILYDFIDNSSFYYCSVQQRARSIVNICFNTKDKNMDDLFVAKAAENGLLALKGHNKVGGLRASLYNAMPIEGVKKLIQFMEKFSREYS
jgi:phosphoserine aminotransferase